MTSEKPVDGIDVARHIKFFIQMKNPYVIYKLSLSKVQPKVLYNNHKKQFDLLANICSKYNVDVFKYCDFFINRLNKHEKDIDCSLVASSTLNRYVEMLKISEQQSKIYKNVLKTVDFIVYECLDLNFNTTIDYLRYLISEKKLAAYYMTGKISAYYLAAIPKFNLVICKLDDISRAELQSLHDMYDKYHSNVNEAFIRFKHIKFNPIKFTNDKILLAKHV